MATSRATARSSGSGSRPRRGRSDEVPKTAVEIAPAVYGEPLQAHNASWFLAQTLCYLEHLERLGRVRREPLPEAEGWVRA